MPGPLDRILAGGGGVASVHEPGRGAQAAHIAQLVRTILALPACREADCPPVETVIAVLAAPPRRWNLHCAVSAISDQTLTRLLAEHPDGGTHDIG